MYISSQRQTCHRSPNWVVEFKVDFPSRHQERRKNKYARSIIIERAKKEHLPLFYRDLSCCPHPDRTAASAIHSGHSPAPWENPALPLGGTQSCLLGDTALPPGGTQPCLLGRHSLAPWGNPALPPGGTQPCLQPLPRYTSAQDYTHISRPRPVFPTVPDDESPEGLPRTLGAVSGRGEQGARA